MRLPASSIFSLHSAQLSSPLQHKTSFLLSNAINTQPIHTDLLYLSIYPHTTHLIIISRRRIIITINKLYKRKSPLSSVTRFSLSIVFPLFSLLLPHYLLLFLLDWSICCFSEFQYHTTANESDLEGICQRRRPEYAAQPPPRPQPHRISSFQRFHR